MLNVIKLHFGLKSNPTTILINPANIGYALPEKPEEFSLPYRSTDTIFDYQNFRYSTQIQGYHVKYQRSQNGNVEEIKLEEIEKAFKGWLAENVEQLKKDHDDRQYRNSKVHFLQEVGGVGLVSVHETVEEILAILNEKEAT